MTKFLVLALLLGAGLSPASGQEKPELKKNAIHLIPGTGLFWFTGTLAYERRISKRSFARAGAGILAGHDSGEHLFVQYGILLGGKNHHFELSAGPALIRTQLNSIPFSAAGGYRFQKPQGWFIFRAGAAYPELYYLSFGVAF